MGLTSLAKLVLKLQPLISSTLISYKVENTVKVGLNLIFIFTLGLFMAVVQLYTLRCTLGICWKGKQRFWLVPKDIAGQTKKRAKADRVLNCTVVRQIYWLSRVVPAGSKKVPTLLFALLKTNLCFTKIIQLIFLLSLPSIWRLRMFL